MNNVGVFPFSPALETTEALWDREPGINLKCQFLYAQAVARSMIAPPCSTAIINIASIDAFHPTGFLAHYYASKGGTVMLTKSLAKELGPHRVRVNVSARLRKRPIESQRGSPLGSVSVRSGKTSPSSIAPVSRRARTVARPP